MHHGLPDNKQYVPIIIVGAGPIGLTLGNLLGGAGIETLILERNADLSTFPKAISIDDEGLRICQSLGLGAAILEHVMLHVSAHYVSGERFLAKAAPTSRRNGYPLISTFSQPEFEATLLQGLRRFACVNIRFQHTVETFKQHDSSVIVTIRTAEGTTQTIECAYLLACDGGRSAIRRELGIPLQGSTFAQKWLVIDALSSEDAAAVITFYCNPARPAVAVPAPHCRRRWEFMLLPGEKEEQMLDEEKIHELLLQVAASGRPEAESPGRSLPTMDGLAEPGSPMRIIRKAVYTFHAALATTFAQGRIFLIGDAAHLMPPFGGQGMNSGLRDATNLGWKLQLVLQGQASPELLNTYTVERAPHVLQMIRFSSLLGSIVMTRARPVAWLRDGVLAIMNILPPVRGFLSEAGPKPGSHYKQGFLIRDRTRESRRLAGILLPQPEVMLPGGRRVLLDDVLGNGFALLRLSNKPEEAFAAIKAEIWRQLEVRFVCIQSSGKELVECDECVVAGEVQQELSRLLRHRRDLFVLVRPDRHVYGVFRERDAGTFALKFHSSIRGSQVTHFVSPP